mgnify:CR=1 FL=1
MIHFQTFFFRLFTFILLAGLALAPLPAAGSWSVPIPFLADTSPPQIDVWYGDQQSFTLGTPQTWVNILGSVSDPDSGIRSLSYSLNGSTNRTLHTGPDNRRLAHPGDFNIDIRLAPTRDPALVNGSNTVIIHAANNDGLTASRTVTFNYAEGSVWPLPYTVNWAALTHIQQGAQVVDGRWVLTGGGARATPMEYDRVIAIGDRTWRDYEVLVPVTIHAVDTTLFTNPRPASGRPKISIDFRWNGHTNNPDYCDQPLCGWIPTGASAKYQWTAADNGRLALETYQDSEVLDSSVDFVIGRTYWLRARVETVSGGGSLYRMKAWEDGRSEPSAWNLSLQTTPDPSSPTNTGSFLLVAHHVDATFGNVTAAPIGPSTGYTLSVPVAGGGSVAKNPDKPTYNSGEVVTLTAQPAAGWQFANWSGAINHSINPTQVTITGNATITAHFRSLPPQPENPQFIFVPLITR